MTFTGFGHKDSYDCDEHLATVYIQYVLNYT